MPSQILSTSLTWTIHSVMMNLSRFPKTQKGDVFNSTVIANVVHRSQLFTYMLRKMCCAIMLRFCIFLRLELCYAFVPICRVVLSRACKESLPKDSIYFGYFSIHAYCKIS